LIIHLEKKLQEEKEATEKELRLEEELINRGVGEKDTKTERSRTNKHG
jgi:hypothetical protein